MKYEIRPFVMLNDIEGIYEFADENPSPVPFSVDTIRIGYPIVDYGKESYHDFPTSDGSLSRAPTCCCSKSMRSSTRSATRATTMLHTRSRTTASR